MSPYRELIPTGDGIKFLFKSILWAWVFGIICLIAWEIWNRSSHTDEELKAKRNTEAFSELYRDLHRMELTHRRFLESVGNKKLCEHRAGNATVGVQVVVCNDGTAYILFGERFVDARCIQNGKIDPDIGWDDLDCGNL